MPSCFSLISRSAALLAAAVIVPISLTGCSMGAIDLSGPVSTPATVSVNMAGKVHGGNQPVTGATIQLVTVGNTGYGSTGTKLITPGGIGSIALTSGGSGYAVAPTVSFTGGSGSGAAATATLGTGATAGQVVSLTLTAAGSGYSSVPTIVFTGANTTAATATAIKVAAGGVVTDANGDFTITGDYTCPSPSTLVAVTSTGGNPGLAAGTNNTAIQLVAPLGPCGNLSASTYVFINEVTTAATAFAMGQYFTTTFGSASTDSFGAPNTAQAQVGINNAYATVGNLVNTSNGTAVVTNTLTNSVGSITITPEFAKLYTIADILAACVNSTGASSSNCTTLFTSAVPTGGVTPTDTLQAAVDLSLNPTSTNANGSAANLTSLFGLVSGTPPFGAVTTQPTDWTLGITYGSNSQVASTSYLLTDPEHVAIDAQGNVWLGNFGTTASGNSVTELSPTGTPITQVLTTVGGTNRNLAIDPLGNVWLPDSYLVVGTTATSAKGTTLYEYTTAGATNVFTTGNDPASVAFDGVGNAFVLEPSFANTATASGAASLGTLEEIPLGSANGAVATTIATNLDTDFSSLTVDSHYTLWVTGGGSAAAPTAAAGLDGLYQFLKNSGTGTGYPAAPTATAVPTALAGATVVSSVTEPESAIAVNQNGDILAANFGKSTIGGVAGTSTTTLTAAANTPITATGLTAPQFEVIDGAGNIWVPQASSTGNVFAYSATGTALSPTGGFVHTYKEPYGIAIDPSGNVWVGNENAAATATVQGYVTEIVGAAVPVVTPIAAGLPTTAGGTSTLGTRP